MINSRNTKCSTFRHSLLNIMIWWRKERGNSYKSCWIYKFIQNSFNTNVFLQRKSKAGIQANHGKIFFKETKSILWFQSIQQKVSLKHIERNITPLPFFCSKHLFRNLLFLFCEVYLRYLKQTVKRCHTAANKLQTSFIFYSSCHSFTIHLVTGGC